MFVIAIALYYLVGDEQVPARAGVPGVRVIVVSRLPLARGDLDPFRGASICRSLPGPLDTQHPDNKCVINLLHCDCTMHYR